MGSAGVSLIIQTNAKKNKRESQMSAVPAQISAPAAEQQVLPFSRRGAGSISAISRSH